MRAGRPSLTASLVALARGLGEDRLAERLLPAPLGLTLRMLRAASERLPGGPLLASVATVGLVDHLALRTAEIDRALSAGVKAGMGQVVILGAGLDARAYRMPELHATVVFEVDHPATQAYKRARVTTLIPTAEEVRFVALDFERGRLSEALASAGQRSDVPTFFIWEGVTPYLHPAAVRASLAEIAARSASGSRLAMTYATPEMTTLPVSKSVAHAAFGLIGEPLHGLMTPREVALELDRNGFRLESDTSAGDWGRASAHPRPWALVVTERLAMAERRQAQPAR